MSLPLDSSGSWSGRKLGRVAQTIVVSSVMFTFISYWRTAAIVLCDMSSTAYYIGAIVETAIGQAAPWFILGVLLFSYGMRSVYIESCALFVRGGVYRVVKEAMGGFLAKLSVSALLFDYVLTGPISGVSAGQYIVGLILETFTRQFGVHLSSGASDSIKQWGSVAIACLITIYFFRQNLFGIHESSDKALKIMIATTIMAVVLLSWAGVTLIVKGHDNPLPTWKPDLTAKLDPSTGEKIDPLGWIGNHPSLAEPLRNPTNWLSLIGAVGIIIAFGHSILAMSGEETLAQVYREVESPKLPNFKKAAFIVFLYSLLLTASTNFLAVLMIPQNQRLDTYHDNWLGGLAMQMLGPLWMQLCLNAFVVIVGFLILAGAVNTSIVGSNGVLSRVAEDGVLPDWFLKPHRKYGTTNRLLYLITGLQLFTILVSHGDVIMLGEAYAFGVVWSFVFKTLSMVMLRFKDHTPREFLVPLNIKWGRVHVPIGLSIVFLIVFLSALANLFTKPVATVSGLCFTGVFLGVFVVTERYHHRRHGADHKHEEQFNRAGVDRVTGDSLSLKKPYRKLVAIRSPHNLFMLEKALADTDPQTTEVIVMTAKMEPPGGASKADDIDLDTYDRQLMTAVVTRAEKLGKRVLPLIVPTNNPLNAVLTTAKDIGAQEVMLGASNKFTAEEQLDQIALYWISLNEGNPQGLTVHIVSADRDVSFDLEGGNRIPKAAQRQARSASELRAAGIGVRQVLMAHDGTHTSSDVFEWLLTMLSSEVALDVVPVLPLSSEHVSAENSLDHDRQHAHQLKREVKKLTDQPPSAAELARLARTGKYNVIVLPWSEELLSLAETDAGRWVNEVFRQAPCSVFLASPPVIPKEVVADG
ncbi:MAG TPA: APC family permease [Pirellulales bacterium]|nr:APC family permease [Pirellulales bacterium]